MHKKKQSQMDFWIYIYKVSFTKNVEQQCGASWSFYWTVIIQLVPDLHKLIGPCYWLLLFSWWVFTLLLSVFWSVFDDSDRRLSCYINVSCFTLVLQFLKRLKTVNVQTWTQPVRNSGNSSTERVHGSLATIQRESGHIHLLSSFNVIWQYFKIM